MTGRADLASLRATLGRGPTELLLWLAAQSGKVGPIASHRIHDNKEMLRQWRRKLESAGLVRVTLHRGKGCEYEIIAWEAIPIRSALEELKRERAAEAERVAATESAAEAKRQKQREYRERWMRKKFGSCPECGAAPIERNGRRGNFLGCTGWPACGFTAPTKADIEAAHRARTLARAEHEKVLCEQSGSCGKCGAPMALINGKNGLFLGCTAYPRCCFTQSVQVENWPPLVTHMVQ
jgi:ssDNA-binding Zn-finger/Zn-ribbon topoisomerase 1